MRLSSLIDGVGTHQICQRFKRNDLHSKLSVLWPRVLKFVDARNIQEKKFEFDDSVLRMADADDQKAFRVIVALMKVLLVRTLAPKRVADVKGSVVRKYPASRLYAKINCGA